MDNSKEFLIWTIVVPLLLLGMTVLQEIRAFKSMAGEARYVAVLAKDVPALEAIQARNPAMIIHFSEDGVEKPVAEALELARRAQRHMALIEKLRIGSVVVPVLGGLACLAVMLVGFIGLRGISQVQQMGMHSRDALVQGFAVWQGRLTIVLCVLSGGLCAAIVCVLGFEAWDHVIKNMHLRLDVWGLVRAGFFILTLSAVGVYVVYKIHKAWSDIFIPSVWDMTGFQVTEHNYPKFWNFVQEVAHNAGARPPDVVVLGLEPTFYITAGAVELYPETSYCEGTILYVSAPMMAYLSQDELASIVAHELGHYKGEDLEYSQKFLPLYIRARRQLNIFADKSKDEIDWMVTSRAVLEPARMLAERFFVSLDMAVHFWSRCRELAADAVSAQVVGPRTAAKALLRITALGSAMDEGLYLWHEAPYAEDAVLELAYLLEGPDGILSFVQRVIEAQGLLDPREVLEDAMFHPSDTHPLTGQRLEAWGVEPDEALVCHAMQPQQSDLLCTMGLLPESIVKATT